MKKIVFLLGFSFLLSACTSMGTSEQTAQDTALNVKYSFQNTGVETKSLAVGTVVGAAAGGALAVGIPAGAAMGAVVGGAVGHYLSEHETKVAELQKRGIYFFKLGDQVMIVVPSQLIFVGNSARIRQSAAPTMDLLVELLSDMTKISVKVAGFTASPSQTEQDIELSSNQAEAVESYLWESGVDARLMYVVGYGGGHPWIYGDPSFMQNNVNARIEITLTDLSHAEGYQ